MKWTFAAILVFSLAFFGFVSSSIQAEDAKDYCKKCSSTGKIRDDKYPIPYPYYCSSSINPDRSHDAGWRPCDKCVGTRTNAQARKEYDDWVGSLTAWTENRRTEIDKKIFGVAWDKQRVIHFETSAWVFSTNMVGRKMEYLCLPYPVPKWLARELKIEKVTKSKLKNLRFSADDDLAARIYAERLEYFYSVFLKVFERDIHENKGKEEGEEGDLVDEPEEEPEEIDDWAINKVGVGGGKWGFYIWRTEGQQKAASHYLTGNTSENGVTLYAPWSLHTFHDKERGDDDMMLHKVVHSASQVVLSDYLKYERDSVPSWFDEGLAHWFEYYLLGSCRVCSRKELLWEPVIPQTGLRGKVYDMVKNKKFEPLTAYAGFDVDKLTTNHRVIDFSIVDYMLKDSKKVRE